MSEQQDTKQLNNARPGRRSLRIGLIVASIIAVAAVVLVVGVLIGAFHSERVHDSINAMRSDTNESKSTGAQTEGGFWTCGMHPWVILPEPGLCPICHMDLTPLDPTKLSGEITIDPVIVQNIGVRIASVTGGSIEPKIRTVGEVSYDESSVREITTKVSGWIEALHVDAEGQRVEKGDPLLDIYSPELYQAQEEYLLAWRQRRQGGQQTGGLDLLEAARTRLKYFDIADRQIEQLEQSDAPQKALTMHSLHAGVVVEKRALEGMRIEPGMLLYRIADLSTIWVNVTVYENQLPFIRVDQQATMTLPFLPGKVYEGRVAYIYPYLNEQARQARVRLEFENPDSELLPGMYATVEIAGEGPLDAVLAPREAILSTGARHVAFVSRGEGRFEPREVTLGVSSGGQVQILDGLEPGEKIVTSGQFLLDSESRMREALAKMVTGDTAAAQRPDVKVVESEGDIGLPQEGRDALTMLLKAYLMIADALVNDTIEGTSEPARVLETQIGALRDVPPLDNPHFWHMRSQDLDAIAQNAKTLAGASGIEHARRSFGYISDALERIVTATGVPNELDIALDRRVCGMAPEVPRSGVWLQPSDQDARNPYFGAMMLRCNLPAEHLRLPVMGADGNVSESAQSGDES